MVYVGSRGVPKCHQSYVSIICSKIHLKSMSLSRPSSRSLPEHLISAPNTHFLLALDLGKSPKKKRCRFCVSIMENTFFSGSPSSTTFFASNAALLSNWLVNPEHITSFQHARLFGLQFLPIMFSSICHLFLHRLMDPIHADFLSGP